VRLQPSGIVYWARNRPPAAWWSSRLQPGKWPLMQRGSCGTDIRSAWVRKPFGVAGRHFRRSFQRGPNPLLRCERAAAAPQETPAGCEANSRRAGSPGFPAHAGHCVLCSVFQEALPSQHLGPRRSPLGELFRTIPRRWRLREGRAPPARERPKRRSWFLETLACRDTPAGRRRCSGRFAGSFGVLRRSSRVSWLARNVRPHTQFRAVGHPCAVNAGGVVRPSETAASHI